MMFTALTHEQACAALRDMPGVRKWDHLDMQDIGSVIGTGNAFCALGPEGERLAVFVVQQVQHARGRELVIRVARQMVAGEDLTAKALPEIERVFGLGCDVVTIHTKRPGLVKKLERAGYAESAKIMRKKLQ